MAELDNTVNREPVAGASGLTDRVNEADSKDKVVNGKRERTVALSGRMRMLADMVTAGSCAADVGCDHAFLPIYLVQTGKCPKCLAMDVRKGPLSGAEKHIASCGLEEYIETRLSDGLSAYHKGEAQTLICAGMGGRLMEKILTEGGEKTRAFSELILQPQSELPEFRIFLREAGFLITEEEAVYEDGKYYFAMKAVYRGRNLSMEQNRAAGSRRSAGRSQSVGEGKTSAEQSQSSGQDQSVVQGMVADQTSALETKIRGGAVGSTEYEIPGRQEASENELYDLYGKQLLLGKHPVLKQYLLKRKQAVEVLIIQLERKGSQRSEIRKGELFLEKEHLESALALLQADE